MTSAPPPPRRTAVSVCMAVYNGMPWLEQQVGSILAQLQPGDELVVVDDGSADASVEFLRSVGDARLVLHRNPRNLGVNRTFERAIGACRHDVIAMADQDDVWVPGRLDAMVASLQDGAWLVSGNFDLIDAQGAPLASDVAPLRAADSDRNAANIAGIFLATRNYYGCAMAFRRELLPRVLPFPAWLESHDLWIAMGANLAGRSRHLESVTLQRRIHGNNASVVQRPWTSKLRSRAIFALSLLVLGARALRRRTEPAPSGITHP